MVTAAMVREELGSPSTADLTDSVIDRILFEENGGFTSSVSRCARILWRKYATLASYAVDDLRLDYGQRAKMWQEIAEEYALTANYANLPYAGAISTADKEQRARDTTKTSPSFRRGLFERTDVDESN